MAESPNFIAGGAVAVAQLLAHVKHFNVQGIGFRA
jgi:hypothetical protein